MAIDDIRRLPDEAFAAKRCKACEASAPCRCLIHEHAIDRDALRDCIIDRLVFRLSPGVAELLAGDIVANILKSFVVRLKP